jgi:hypothetical protein
MTLVFACGDCRMLLDGVANPRPDSMLKCLSCGQAETFDNIRQIVAEYLQENARDKIGAMLGNIASRSESLTLHIQRATKPRARLSFYRCRKGITSVSHSTHATVHLIGFRREAHANSRSMDG